MVDLGDCETLKNFVEENDYGKLIDLEEEKFEVTMFKSPSVSVGYQFFFEIDSRYKHMAL